MTDTQRRPYPRRRRRVELTDSPTPDAEARTPEVEEPAEGHFEYGSRPLPENPANRYRRIKQVEGEEAARAWALSYTTEHLLTGTKVEDIAKDLGFSLRYARGLVSAARAKIKVDAIDSFDVKGWVAVHLDTYRVLRERSLHFFLHSTHGYMERTRAHEQLLATMRQEADFIRDLGGVTGAVLVGREDDDETRNAKQMNSRLMALAEAVETVMAMDTGDTLEPEGDDELAVDTAGESQAGEVAQS